VGHCIQKGPLALVAAHFLQEPGTEPCQTDHHEQKKDRSKDQEQPIAGVKARANRVESTPQHHLPSNSEEQQEHHQNDADGEPREYRSA
jgi:hypothetical protein